MSDRLPETGDDLVDDKQIHASRIGPGIIEHRSFFSDSSRDIWNEVQVEKWRLVRPLGHGGFGHVFLEELLLTENHGPQPQPQLRAVKVIPEKEEGVKTKLHLAEILGMAKFSKYGAFFIQLFAWFTLGSEICIAMEWAPYGDLKDCVLKPIPEDEACDIARQLCQAILIMHERRFLHRDLKPKNIFVFRKPPESIGWRVKLGDFGVSKRVREASNTSWHTSIEAECSAPEVRGLIDGDHAEEASYANPVDMWSLGYVVHWLLTQRYPVSPFALPRHCFKMEPLPLTGLADAGASTQALAFVEKLLQLSPDERMTAQQACSHPWLSMADNKPPYLSETVTTDQASRSTSALPTNFVSPWIVSQSSARQYLGYRIHLQSPGSLPDPGNNRSLSHEATLPQHNQNRAPLLTARDELVKKEREAAMQAADAGRIRELEEDRPSKVERTFSIPKKRRAGIIIKDPTGNIIDLKNPILENIRSATSASEEVNVTRPEQVFPADIKNDTVADNDYIATEAELAAMEAETAALVEEEERREVEYMMKKEAAQKEADRKRAEEEAAAVDDITLKYLERLAEEEEERRLKEIDDRKHSPRDIELFSTLRSYSSHATNDEKAVDSGDFWSVHHLGTSDAGHENKNAVNAHNNVPQPTSPKKTWATRFEELMGSSPSVSDPTESSSPPQSKISKSQKRRQKKKQLQQQAGKG